MGESAKQRGIVRASRTGAFIAADVGGTHARIGLVRRAAGSNAIDVLRYERYACADWPSLTAVLQDFVGRLEGQDAIEHCAVASAGYVLGDAIVNENLPWPVSIGDIRATLGLTRPREPRRDPAPGTRPCERAVNLAAPCSV